MNKKNSKKEKKKKKIITPAIARAYKVLLMKLILQSKYYRAYLKI
jgi:uncharacterized protein YueI